MQPQCTVRNCTKPTLARGWCRTHYTRWYETGDVELGVRPPKRTNYKRTPPHERVLRRSEETPEGCWEFKGALSNGYGTVKDAATNVNKMAHRAVWEYLRGDIPEGLHLDHLCENKACVNPEHLDPVTPGENTRRARESAKH